MSYQSQTQRVQYSLLVILFAQAKEQLALHFYVCQGILLNGRDKSSMAPIHP